jgi:23S rRNA C2498 (ribose-2'-O)-methylase RlmM
MNNSAARQKFIAMEDKLKNAPSSHRISKIHGFYMSVLEHEWVIILEAEAAHDIETFCIDVGISATSTVKIVPLNNFEDVVKRVKSAGSSP